MSEQNVEQSDGALPVNDIEGVHADPTAVSAERDAGDDFAQSAKGESDLSPEQADQSAYRQ